MDMQQLDGEWSVDKVLEVINKTCRSWRGEGMKVLVSSSFTSGLKLCTHSVQNSTTSVLEYLLLASSFLN
jgi:hypothetical protein